MTAQRLVPASTIHHHLEALLKNNTVRNVAHDLGMNQRHLNRIRVSTGQIYATTADKITLLAGETHTPHEPTIARAAAAAYARTPEGMAFIAKCRAPKKPKRVAA